MFNYSAEIGWSIGTINVFSRAGLLTNYRPSTVPKEEGTNNYPLYECTRGQRLVCVSRHIQLARTRYSMQLLYCLAKPSNTSPCLMLVGKCTTPKERHANTKKKEDQHEDIELRFGRKQDFEPRVSPRSLVTWSRKDGYCFELFPATHGCLRSILPSGSSLLVHKR